MCLVTLKVSSCYKCVFSFHYSWTVVRLRVSVEHLETILSGTLELIFQRNTAVQKSKSTSNLTVCWWHFKSKYQNGYLTKMHHLTCWSDRNGSHLFYALYNLYPFPSIFMRPFRSVALVNPFIGWRHSGNYQLKQSVPSGNQSDAPVGESPRKLCPDDHLALRTKCQNFLRCGPPLHRPGDGQVGRLRELPGDVARQSEVASLWDDWGWGLRGDFEGIGNNWKEREKRKKTSLISLHM